MKMMICSQLCIVCEECSIKIVSIKGKATIKHLKKELLLNIAK
jgi:hypothetical protein